MATDKTKLIQKEEPEKRRGKYYHAWHALQRLRYGNKVTSSKLFVKRIILFGVASIYLIAFTSFCIQIPGLFGDNGLLPARLEENTTASYIRYAKHYNLDYESAMELTCIFGIIIASWCILFGGNSILFGLLWGLYMALYQIGGDFLGFQWDILLLEVGLITILIAPLNLFCLTYPFAEFDSITMWLVKWLTFRLMFASGILKLQSNGPTWWGLVALDWHFESQCIPKPMAYNFHFMPKWFRMLSTATTFIIQIPTPFLFFAPTMELKYFACFAQMFGVFAVYYKNKAISLM